jgi:hypothetical protein
MERRPRRMKTWSIDIQVAIAIGIGLAQQETADIDTDCERSALFHYPQAFRSIVPVR